MSIYHVSPPIFPLPWLSVCPSICLSHPPSVPSRNVIKNSILNSSTSISRRRNYWITGGPQVSMVLPCSPVPPAHPSVCLPVLPISPDTLNSSKFQQYTSTNWVLNYWRSVLHLLVHPSVLDLPVWMFEGTLYEITAPKIAVKWKSLQLVTKLDLASDSR